MVNRSWIMEMWRERRASGRVDAERVACHACSRRKSIRISKKKRAMWRAF
jgi:hypothetical protein